MIAMCGRQNNGTLKDIHALTPITYKYGTLHDKSDFVDVTEIVGLKNGQIILDLEEHAI